MPVAHLHATRLFYVEVGEGVPCLVMHGGLGGGHCAAATAAYTPGSTLWAT
jgi:hypothetical protein